jgi:nucleoside-diphosphate-sugar epimerase
MKIAITGAAGFLGRVLTPKLAALHEVFPSDLEEAEAGMERVDVLEREDVQRLCAGMEVVIHLACAAWQDGLSEAENETRILDTRLKGTWNVMQAAVDAGVQRVIQVSDLCVFSGYDNDVMVSEDFIPLPDTTAHQQSVYLSELIGREFARQEPGLVLTLRLGKLVDAGGLPADAVFDPAWLDTTDAVNAIVRALDLNGYDGLSNWGLYDLAADVSNARFSLLKIKSGQFGFRPAENFSAWRKEGTA